MTSHTLFVQDTTLIDYIRIATFDSIAYVKLSALMEDKYHGWKHTKWLQYSGRKTEDNIFHGSGSQAGRAHYIVSVSGSGSQEFYRWFIRQVETITSAFYCTRIDLQRTQARPLREYRVNAYKRNPKGKTLYQSDKGITLYVGSRTSDTFWRIYDKTKSLMRLELELKGKQSKRALLALNGGESASGIWNRYLLRSKVPKVYADYFRADCDSANLETIVVDETHTLQSKLDWLKTLDALVYKLANDHDTAEGTRILIDRWYAYVSGFDSYPKTVVECD